MSEREESAEPAVDHRSVSDRAAMWVFVAVIVAAVPIIFHQARDQWFFLDEWDFLAGRDLDSIGSLLQPHNEHWSTVPIVVYRVIWQFVGLNHYWPYLLVLVVLHLTLAVELRMLMRRAGVHPWIATAAASLFAVFGGGRENITWAFQMGFTGSVTFGVAAILLADHDQGSARARERDIAAAIALLLALMSSGIGVSLMVAVAVSILLRRGWRPATFIVGPSAVAFTLWYVRYGDRSTPLSFNGDAVRLASRIVSSTSGQVGATTVLGYLLFAAGLVGFVIALVREGRTRWRGEWAPVIGMLVGAGIFLSLTSVGRAVLSLEPATRYRHIFLALVLPAIGVGLTALGRLWKPAVWIAVAMLAAAIPVNVDRLEPHGLDRLTLGGRHDVLAILNADPPPAAPSYLQPLQTIAPEVTLGWIDDAERSGKIPAADPMTDLERGTADLRVSFRTLGPSSGHDCTDLGRYQPARLERGDVLRVPVDQILITEISDGEPVSGPIDVRSALGEGAATGEVVLRAYRPMVLRVQAPGVTEPTEVCDRI
ncbi:MAG: hypothetical protein KF906_03480 [Actinobacteria bacterium]|nr:hypothetical protein [Actinomycetota bacterium]